MKTNISVCVCVILNSVHRLIQYQHHEAIRTRPRRGPSVAFTQKVLTAMLTAKSVAVSVSNK